MEHLNDSRVRVRMWQIGVRSGGSWWFVARRNCQKTMTNEFNFICLNLRGHTKRES